MATIDIDNIKKEDFRGVSSSLIGLKYSCDGSCFKIRTYGSDKRQNSNATQVIDFDKDTAIKLISILKKEFNL